MKRKLWVIILLIMIFPSFVYALDINEYPPYINLKNSDKYDVEKIITSDEVIIRLREKGNTTYYSWAFNKDEVGDYINIDFEVKYNTDNKDEIDNLAGNIDKKYISFTHHGDLPAKAKVTVYVADKYKNGDELYLYYYNEEKQEIEFIDKDLKVAGGYVEFTIEHCSDYFLTKKVVASTNTIVNDKVSEPKNMNGIIIGLLAVICVLVGTTLFTNKK